jgi:hypothetical protein
MDIKKLYSEEQIKKEGGHILDMNENLDFNVNDLIIEIYSFVEFINNNKKLEINDHDIFIDELNKKFPLFKIKYNTIYCKLLDKKNRKESLNDIIYMIKTIINIKKGNTSYDDGLDNCKLNVMAKKRK